MNSAQFKEVYTDLVVEPLIARGFRRVRNNLHYEEHQGILSLMLSGGGRMNAARCWDICLGVRHRFLRRILDLTTRSDFAFEVIDYPIRIGPLRDSHRKACDWVYSTNLLGSPDSHGIDGVWYGDDVDDKVVRENLERIVTTTLGYGMDIMKIFDPQTAANAISEKGTQAWCENMWLEDYAKYLKGRQ